MAAKQFNLMTEWHLDAPVERVWPLLTSIEEWPLWWRAVSQVRVHPPDHLEDGLAVSADL